MSKLNETIKRVKAIIDNYSPIIFPEVKPAEPLLSEKDADLIVHMAVQRYLQEHSDD